MFINGPDKDFNKARQTLQETSMHINDGQSWRLFNLLFQMKDVTKEKCRLLIESYEPSKDGREKGHLGIDGKLQLGYPEAFSA